MPSGLRIGEAIAITWYVFALAECAVFLADDSRSARLTIIALIFTSAIAAWFFYRRYEMKMKRKDARQATEKEKHERTVEIDL